MNDMDPCAHLDDHSYSTAVAQLAEKDPALQAIVEEFGDPPFWCRPPGFETLVQIILEQQVSLASARATYARLVSHFGRVDPEDLKDATPEQLRKQGVSRQKAVYVAGLARSVLDGTLDLDGLEHLGDEAVRESLTSLKGIGDWSADVYLLIALRRPDIWPIGDVALVTATVEVLDLPNRPTGEEMIELGRAWSPWRAVATRLLWHHYLSRRGQS